MSAPVVRNHLLPWCALLVAVLTGLVELPLSGPSVAQAQGVRAAVLARAAEELEIATALAVHRSYLDAVRAGDDAMARFHWHPAETARYPVYDWALDYRRWRMPLEGLIDSVVAARRSGDQVVLVLQWTSGSTGDKVGEDVRYFVPQAERLVAVNPIFLATRDWQSRTGGHIVYHWRGPTDPFDQALLTANEERLLAAAAALNVTPQPRFDFYLCGDRELVGKLFGQPPSHSRVHEKNGVVATLMPFAVHGLVRSLYYAGYPDPSRGNPFGAVSGGIAFALAGGVQGTAEWVRMRARELAATGGFAGLRSSFAGLNADETTLFAPHMAAVCDFVLSQYGPPTFFDWGLRSRHWNSVISAFRYGLGTEWTVLEPEVMAWVAEPGRPWIEAGPALGAAAGDTLLLFEDPAGDGTGTGGLMLPAGVDPGAFDLVALRVARRDAQLVVEVEFAAAPPAGTDWGFADLMLQLVLHTGPGPGEDRLLDTGLAALPLALPYQYIVDLSPQGVLLQSWRGEWLGGRYAPVADELPLVRGNRLQVSLPLELIGEPTADWRYQLLLTGHHAAADVAGGVGRSTAWSGPERTAAAGTLRIYDLLLPPGIDQAQLLAELAAGREETRLPLVP